ncbi:energy transducer TonB [soil metagenome]
MKLLIPCFLLMSFSCFAQSVRTPSEETEKRGTIKIEKSNCVKLSDNDSVYAYVDQMPEFNGGGDTLYQWINHHLNYPKKALEEDRSGTVFCSFVVLKNGKISNIKFLKTGNSDFEKEALRLIKLMPDWIPGRCNGVLVDVKINFPIKFTLK